MILTITSNPEKYSSGNVLTVFLQHKLAFHNCNIKLKGIFE